MNHIYNVKFNKNTGQYQAVGEQVSLNGKGSRGAKALIAAMVGTLSLYTMAAEPGALPTGGAVVHGAAAISSKAGNMLIQQSSTNATINWTSYNVGARQTVTYQTPGASSITMNRISGGANVIEGAVTSNGSLWFATPGGSLSVMQGGKVQSVGGEVYITTQDLKAGIYEKAKGLATVGSGTANVNKGQLFGSNITIDAGAVNLDNATLTAGSAAAPGQVVVKGAGDIRITQSAITAEGGSIAIGREAYAQGDLSGSTAVTDSTLKAVQIETSGAELSTSGNTVAAQEWLLDPTNITIAATATASSVLTASSAASAASGAITVTPTDIQNAVNAGTSVTLAGTGTITQSAALTFNITATGKTPTFKLDNTTGAKQNITLTTITDNTAASGSGVSLQVLSAGGTITSGGVVTLKAQLLSTTPTMALSQQPMPTRRDWPSMPH
jgi:filamentous hemagglutinin family protein